MGGTKRKKLGAIIAGTLIALAAVGAEAGPRTYDLDMFIGADPFAAQFWGQTPGELPVTPVVPPQAPIQVLPVAEPPPVAAVELEAGLRPIPPLSAAPVEIYTENLTRFLPSMTGRYMVGNFGVGLYADATNSGASVNHKTAYDSGLAMQIALGYEWSPEWKLEAEFAVRNSTTSSIIPSGTAAVTATGNLLTTSFMANGVREFNAGWLAPRRGRDIHRGQFTPYFVLGGGLARVQARNINAAGVSNTNSSDWALAYQLGSGVDYPLSGQWSVDASYKFFATTKPELTNAAGVSYESSLAVHNFFIGTRYRF